MKNSWLFPVIESIHLTGLAVLVGTIVIVDLRLLGFGMLREPISQLARQLAPWTRRGLAIMLVTGPILFSSDIARYSQNPAFRFKMAFLLLALVSHFTIHRGAIARDESRLTPARRRLAALLSLTLWTCVVIGGRGIADFDLS